METNKVSPDYQKHQHLHNTSKFTVIIINRHAIYTHLHHFYSKGTGSAKCFPVQQRTLRAQEQSRSSCSKFPAYWLYYPLITGSGSTQLCAVEKLFHNERVRFTFPSYFHIHKSCFEWQMSIRIRNEVFYFNYFLFWLVDLASACESWLRVWVYLSFEKQKISRLTRLLWFSKSFFSLNMIIIFFPLVWIVLNDFQTINISKLEPEVAVVMLK